MADSLIQLVLALVVATMFWIDGPAIATELRDVLRRLGGETAAAALDTTAARSAASPMAWSGPRRSRAW